MKTGPGACLWPEAVMGGIWVVWGVAAGFPEAVC